ncbi:sensor histidine kinase [Natronorubrum sp. DTA7]|uniref:sensor histidine kinase n=1 Tax=Natronorubrum sp. DTA7 TaxID=3447016 RepID=UPI003F83E1BE
MKAELPFEQKAAQALELGTRYLGVENGHMTKIDAETDYWKATASTDPIDGAFPPGLVLDLQTTYCRRTIAQDEPIALHDASNQGWENDPAFAEHGLECYHGTTITVDDDVYGTVCFVSTGPRSDPFGSDETMFAELIARMLEHELERRRTEAQIEQLDTFASTVSHDLRSPLTVIQGWVEATEQSANIEYLRKVYPAVDRMQQLLDDVLATARSGQVIGNVEPISLETVTRTAWDQLETGSHELVVETDAVARADQERLQAVFENLFRNSVEHGSTSPASQTPEDPADHGSTDPTETGGSAASASPESVTSGSPSASSGGLTITVGDISDANGNPVGFYVEDDGCGIPESDRESIFETGFTTASLGTGFGLSIVQSIVSAHDWSTDLAESEAGGARFEIANVDFQ